VLRDGIVGCNRYSSAIIPLWNFLAGIKKDLQQQKARLMQSDAGLEHPRKKKYRNLND